MPSPIATPIQVVIDTNVFIAAMRSRKGASSQLFASVGDRRWENNISSALLFEYEEKARELQTTLIYPLEEILQILDDITNGSKKAVLYRNWRPIAREPDDDFVLDLAIGCHADYLITFNTRNFSAARTYGIKVVTPGEFLHLVEVL